MKKLAFFVRIVDNTNEWFGNILCYLMVPMLLVMLFEILMRYVFKSPTTWGIETSSFLFASYCLLGGGYTLLKQAHVNMNVFYARLSARRKALFDIITFVAVFLYCAVLIREGWRLTWEAFEMGRRSGSDWNPIVWPIMLTLPVGALLMLLQAIVKLIRDIYVVKTGKKEPFA